MMRALPILIVLLLAACAGPQIMAPGPGAAAPALSERHFTGSDGFRLRYSSWQASAPKAVLLALHGMNDYGEAFAEAGAYWAGQGITVYAYDQRGFGRTLGDGLWPGEAVLTQDLKETARILRMRHPGLPLHVLGESMGAAVALTAFGLPQPPEAYGLILVAPALRGWSDLGLLEKASLWSLAHVTPGSRLSGRGLGIEATDNKERLRAMVADPYVLKRTRIDALYGLVSLMERANEAANAVQVPTFIVYGTRDTVAPQAPMQALASRLKGKAVLQPIPGGYHMLLRDKNPEWVWRAIAERILTKGETLTPRKH